VDTPEHPLFEAVIRGVGGAGVGLLLGALFLGVGFLRAAVAVLGGTHVDTGGLWPAAGVYVLGFAAGGAVMGALWPFQPSRWRQYLAGVAGGVTVVAAVARIADGPTATWGLRTFIMIIGLGSLFGAAFTRGLRRPPAG